MFNKKSKIELRRQLEQETFKRITCSFYRYIEVKNPEDFRNHLYEQFSHLNILGRVYVAREGINAQISVPEHKWGIFEDYINSETLLNGVKLKKAVQEGSSFIKLKILVKNEIVAYGVDKDSYDMNRTGQHLSAKEFNQSIKEEGSIVVDMRNYYESEVGKFKNAISPDIHRSQELLPAVEELLSDDRDKKVHLYCTGGIRCEKASAYLLKKGFKDEFFDRFNYEQYGGSPILGVNAPVIIGHGISSPEAIKNMILLSKTMIESKLVDKIKAAFTS